MKAVTCESLEKTQKSVPKCKFFTRPGGCRFGDKCRYRHQKETKEDKSVCSGSPENINIGPIHVAAEEGTADTISQKEKTAAGETENATVEEDSSSKEAEESRGKKTRTFCRYFMKGGYCREGTKCRFLHPWYLMKSRKNSKKGGQVINENEPCGPPDTGGDIDKKNVQSRRPVVSKPGRENFIESLSELSEESMKYLQKVEIEQLRKRFPQNDVEIMEQDSETVCELKIKPSDPDWPYDVNEVQVTVRFPLDYPKKIFEAEIVEDGTFPENFTKYINQAIGKYLQEHEAAQQLRDTADLLFRPFLRWLDRNLESLFTKTLKQIKFDAEAQSAGLEFIPFEGQQDPGKDETKGETVPCTDNDVQILDKDDTMLGKDGSQGTESMSESTMNMDDKEDAVKSCEPEETSAMFKLIEAKKVATAKKGTEVRFRGLELHENTATVRLTSMTFTVQCSRCKNREEMPNVKENTQVVLTCTRCSNAQSIAMTRSEVVHQHSPTAGFINPQGCVPLDLILTECQLWLGCLNCNKETSIKGIHYGSTKNVWCHHCHQKLDLKVDSTRFHQLQPDRTTDEHLVTVKVKKNAKTKDPAIKSGQPLPENGTCKHYGKSYRWMRFPCCGKCYPCDKCHNEREDHVNELANRMICGFCAKEQSFTQKGCVSCKSFVTAVHTTHWEGGKGCRNKMKMSRGDDKKYSDMSKTVSRHATKIDSKKKK